MTYPVLHTLLEEKDVMLTERAVTARIRKFYIADKSNGSRGPNLLIISSRTDQRHISLHFS